MLTIYDIQTNDSDDIIIQDDIELEEDYFISLIKTAERRVSARYDDFVLNKSGAGLERFLLKFNTDNTRESILYAIRLSLSENTLLSNSDYDILLPKIDSDTLPIYIKMIGFPEDSATFKIIINIKNQRSYR